MAGQKVVVNLATGLEDAERVMIAFFVASSALDRGKQVAMFLTKDAVRLAIPGVAVGVPCEGCPPLDRLFAQYAEKGGEILVCPACIRARAMDAGNLVANARAAGTKPLWEWIGDEPATVFSY